MRSSWSVRSRKPGDPPANSRSLTTTHCGSDKVRPRMASRALSLPAARPGSRPSRIRISGLQEASKGRIASLGIAPGIWISASKRACTYAYPSLSRGEPLRACAARSRATSASRSAGIVRRSGIPGAPRFIAKARRFEQPARAFSTGCALAHTINATCKKMLRLHRLSHPIIASLKCLVFPPWRAPPGACRVDSLVDVRALFRERGKTHRHECRCGTPGGARHARVRIFDGRPQLACPT